MLGGTSDGRIRSPEVPLQGRGPSDKSTGPTQPDRRTRGVGGPGSVGGVWCPINGPTRGRRGWSVSLKRPLPLTQTTLSDLRTLPVSEFRVETETTRWNPFSNAVHLGHRNRHFTPVIAGGVVQLYF